MAIPTRLRCRAPKICSNCEVAFLLPLFVAFVSASAHAQDAQPAVSSLTVVDPYLMTIPSNHSLTASAVISAAATGKVTARGIMTDGTSAAIAVFKTTSNKAVTFTAANGARVAAYSPAFLTTLAAGTASVPVTPTLIGGKYYALALVTTGVAPDAANGTPAKVTASQATTPKITASFSMAALPTPIVLIHGLWGSTASLASTASYLKATPAIKANPTLVTPICYSVYLAFDAATDNLPGHGTGCEMTSAQALNQYLSAMLYKQLDKNHYVGGRVDAVVHSMGGLVARHFAATTGYKSVRNRMLGAFRNVITLDTPETGSALATYLDTTAFSRTLQNTNVFSYQYLAWTGLCGSGSNVTLENCLDKNGLPLSYPGTPLNTGAVWSLIPGGMSLKSAPAATVFNTHYGKWSAIASDFKDGDTPASLLRDILNTLISATYASGQTPPTITSILGTPHNDVIVTVASQISTAVAAQTRQLTDLQHTAAPSAASLLFGSDSNASVVDSPLVNAQVAHWLGLQTSTVPAVSEWVGGTPQEEEPKGAGAVRPRFAAPGRLTVAAPELPVGLGQPAQLVVRTRGPKMESITVDERSERTGQALRNESMNGPAGSGRPRIVSEEEGETTIEVTPLALGPVTIQIAAGFVDGGFARQDVRLNVTPSQRNLRSFALNKGFDSVALVLDDKDEDREASLAPVLEFDSLRYPIYLDSAEGLNLSVEQREDNPVIRVDSGGLIHALHAGKALITGEFDGARDTMEVEVYTKEAAPAGYRRGEDQ